MRQERSSGRGRGVQLGAREEVSLSIRALTHLIQPPGSPDPRDRCRLKGANSAGLALPAGLQDGPLCGEPA